MPGLATAADPVTSYVLNLKLSDPARAGRSPAGTPPPPPAVTRPARCPWPRGRASPTADGLLVADEQQVLMPGAWLAGLLAVASVAVLAGGRMAEQHPAGRPAQGGRRHPGTGRGRAAGREPAPGAGRGGRRAGGRLAGRPADHQPRGRPASALPARRRSRCPPPRWWWPSPSRWPLAATLVPAVRAARTSTVSALADAARPPRRRARLIALSARLPVPLLLGLRLVGPPPAPCRAQRGQHRGHGDRDRRRARLPCHRPAGPVRRVRSGWATRWSAGMSRCSRCSRSCWSPWRS